MNKQFSMLMEAPNSDLGYLASIELDDGSIFTVYYQIDREGEKNLPDGDTLAASVKLKTGKIVIQ